MNIGCNGCSGTARDFQLVASRNWIIWWLLRLYLIALALWLRRQHWDIKLAFYVERKKWESENACRVEYRALHSCAQLIYVEEFCWTVLYYCTYESQVDNDAHIVCTPRWANGDREFDLLMSTTLKTLFTTRIEMCISFEKRTFIRLQCHDFNGKESDPKSTVV